MTTCILGDFNSCLSLDFPNKRILGSADSSSSLLEKKELLLGAATSSSSSYSSSKS
jgi:hypothetical protein